MAYNRRIGKTQMSFNKLAFQCLIRTLVSAFIALIIYMSISFIVTGVNYKPIGYDVLYSEDGENFETVYTYMYTGEEDENWVDPKLQEYMNKEGYYKQNIPNKLSDSTVNTIAWISQILSLAIWGAFIYAVTWNVGNADADKNELGDTPLDKLRGLKAALVALIPYGISYLLLVIAKLMGTMNFAVSLFKILNYNCFAFNDMIITGGLNTISYTELIILALVLLPLPIFAAFGYKMGNRHTLIKEKIVYQNEEKQR